MITIEAEIADFIIEHGGGLYTESERGMIEDFISSHIAFGTMMVCRKDGEIISAVRWNWVSNEEAKILDLVIREGFRNKAILRDMLIRAKLSMPRLNIISFHKKKLGMATTSRHLVDRFIGGFHGKR